jgi:hypothetical protein
MPVRFHSSIRSASPGGSRTRIRESLPDTALILGALALALFLTAPAKAGDPAFTLSNPTIAPAGGVITCPGFELTFTIGEAAVGTVSEADWRMVTGFPATLPDPPPLSDNIFENGFETAVNINAVAKGACAP